MWKYLPLSFESVTQLCLAPAKAAIAMLCSNAKEKLAESITRKSVPIRVPVSIVLLHLWLGSFIFS